MTNYEKLKKEVSEAVQRELAKDAKLAQEEADTRKRYDEAQAEMNQALEAGDKDRYRAAGLAAEAARLDLEFIQKTKDTSRKPGATAEDDRRIRAGIMNEAQQIRIDTFDRLKTLFSDILSVCDEAQKRMTELDSFSSVWDFRVMKKTEKLNAVFSTRMAVAQFYQTINGQLQKFNYLD